MLQPTNWILSLRKFSIETSISRPGSIRITIARESSPGSGVFQAVGTYQDSVTNPRTLKGLDYITLGGAGLNSAQFRFETGSSQQ